jgi:cyclophilin family peptidyl-prolyl cis-trans isomerase/HEAT repeat protein
MVTTVSRSVGALFAGAFAATLALGACGKGRDEQRQPDASPMPSASSARVDPARLQAISSAEQRRSSRDILDTDLTSRDVGVRRAAARALSRIADARAVEHLLKSVSDEDDEVVTWSAYGLGFSCSGREDGVVRRLSARAASLFVAKTDAPPAPPASSGSAGGSAPPARALARPISAIAGALARCGTPEAEKTLRAWLNGERSLADEAALGLGTIAFRTGRLDDATLVALLDAASRPKAPIESALYPFARLPEVSASVKSRLIEVAGRALGAPGTARAFAVRALGAAGGDAAPELARIAGSPAFSDAERAGAVSALARLGEAGQKSLDAVLETLLSDATTTSEAVLLSPRFGVLTALLDAFTLPLGKSAPLLARLTELPLPAAPAAGHRVIALRCRAADLLAGRGTLSPKLLACDPDPNGRVGRLAFVRVLDRGPLKGARLRRFAELAHSKDAVVRQRALELLATHPEAQGIPTFLAEALASKSPGDVATAAELLAKHPDRASMKPVEKPKPSDSDAGAEAAVAPPPSLTPPAPSPDAAVVRALTKALGEWSKAPEIEVRAALLDAAGALELLGAKDRLELDCKSPHPELRRHSEKALARLGQRDRRCDAFEPDYSPPAELAHALTATKTLPFEPDSGPLVIELDPSLAPVAATRLFDLASSGFFDGVAVHRVVPGFVVQLGDPGGDGYGGAKGPPLRCETSPVPFDTGTVGIALGGRDTGSSQFFVMLGRHPHLDGQYAVVGRAGPGWDRIAVGDAVKKVRVGP